MNRFVLVAFGLGAAVVLAASCLAVPDHSDPDHSDPDLYLVLNVVADYLKTPAAMARFAALSRYARALIRCRLRVAQLFNVTYEPDAFIGVLKTVLRDSCTHPDLIRLLTIQLADPSNVNYLEQRLYRAYGADKDVVLDAVRLFLSECRCNDLAQLIVARLGRTRNDLRTFCRPLLDAAAPYYTHVALEQLHADLARILRRHQQTIHWVCAVLPDAVVLAPIAPGGRLLADVIWGAAKAVIRADPGLVAVLARYGIRFSPMQWWPMSAEEARIVAPYLCYHVPAFVTVFADAVCRGQYDAVIILLRQPSLLRSIWMEVRKVTTQLFLYGVHLLSQRLGLQELRAVLDRVPGMRVAVTHYEHVGQDVIARRLMEYTDLRPIGQKLEALSCKP